MSAPTGQERRALIFTLLTTRRNVIDQARTLRRRIHSDNAKLEALTQQLSDIDQSLRYLDYEGMELDR